MPRTTTTLLALAALAAAGLATPAGAASPAPGWVAAWAASADAPDPDLSLAKGLTVREHMRLTQGGGQIRIRLSNAFGTAPLTVGSGSLARPADPGAIKAGTLKVITFHGSASVVIARGGEALSDPVALPLATGDEVAVSLYLPPQPGAATLHALGPQPAVIVRGGGDATRLARLDAKSTTDAAVLVDAILVPARPHQRLIAAIGDSITDGVGDGVDAEHNLPGDLARGLAQARGGAGPHRGSIAVVNEGIAGNQLLHDNLGAAGLARFDRDVLDLPGLTHVLVLEGINDIHFPGAKLNSQLLADPAQPRTAADLIGGYRQLIARAHARGVKVIGATLTPCEGASISGYYSEAKDQIRQAVNQWIRTSGAFDGVADFDAALRDPDHPSRLQPRYASADHLHPNVAGYQAMVDAVNLALLR